MRIQYDFSEEQEDCTRNIVSLPARIPAEQIHAFCPANLDNNQAEFV